MQKAILLDIMLVNWRNCQDGETDRDGCVMLWTGTPWSKPLPLSARSRTLAPAGLPLKTVLRYKKNCFCKQRHSCIRVVKSELKERTWNMVFLLGNRRNSGINGRKLTFKRTQNEQRSDLTSLPMVHARKHRCWNLGLRGKEWTFLKCVPSLKFSPLFLLISLRANAQTRVSVTPG